MYIRKLFILFAFTLSISAAYTQASPDLDKIKALNNYVNFSNESTHGLLIVHRLLENFNKNINKYVDLPDQQINFYSNKDLPQDIFEDAENWFYDTSPNEWFGKIGSYSGILPAATESRLKATATEMKTIITAVNKIRFDLEEQIKTLDLSKRENLSLVYDKLEEGVKLYKSFYTKQLVLEADIDAYYKTLKFSKDEMQFPEVLGTLKSVYTTTRSALTALYNKEDDNFGDLIKAQQTALNNFSVINLADYNSTRLINSRIQMYWGNIKRQVDESIKSEKAFLESENLQEEYKLYDKYYYYYNISVINKFNRYGNGVVFEINRIIDYLGVPVLRYFEMPHYFKVIYPELISKDRFISSSNPFIKSLPKSVKLRKVVTNPEKVVKFDSLKVEFYVIDSKIIDNDKISLSFNGDWILENFRISEKPARFRLELNERGKNYLLLYTDDMGRNPPTTIGISYFYKDKKQIITLTSNAGENELIELLVE